MKPQQQEAKPVGAVMVVGGGIAGMQAALDLGNSGYYVYLVEKFPAIGGTMAQFDKTFPTNDCAMCILSPKLVEVGRHINIELLTLAEVQDISGEEGDFTVTVAQRARYVDMSKCIACGVCATKCPKKVDNEYNQGLDKRKAIYVKYPQAVPLKYVIDKANCLYFLKGRCKACEKFCPAGAINFADQDQDRKIKVGSVIMAPGFKAFDPTGYTGYHYANQPNVITALEFERLLTASGPTMGHLMRPSDHGEPRKIAFLQCVGSREMNRCDHGYCSSVCCMYALKEASLAQEHSGKPLEVAIFYMDMRTFGKDFEKYYEKAKAKGIRFIRSRIHSVDPLKNDDLKIRYVTEDGSMVTEKFDLLVLSQGLEISGETVALAKRLGVELNHYNFARTTNFAPVATSRPGIYACGVFTAPKDIPISVMEASAAACAASSKLAAARKTLVKEKTIQPERDVMGDPPRVGVFICHCGLNIGGIVRIQEVVDYAKTLPFVEFVDQNLFTCSQDTQTKMVEVIEANRLNRIVVAACSPRTHEPLFQEAMVDGGLNKYLFEMANIRNQDSWVHSEDPDGATTKAKDLVRMAVAKAALLTPLTETTINMTPRALVIGGGVAGLNAGLSLSDQGFAVEVVEKSQQLGGQANRLMHTAQGEDIQAYLKDLIARVEGDPNITLHLGTTVQQVDGYIGNFTTRLADGTEIAHGAALIATGAEEYKPAEYLYGQDPRVLTHLDLDGLFLNDDPGLAKAKAFAFIQCVGSREPERPYCSKVCCTHSVMSALEIKKRNPAAQVFILYRDMRTYGLREDLYREARDRGVVFIRFDLDQKPQVERQGENLQITVFDPILQRHVRFTVDYLTLASAIVSSRDHELAQMFKVPLDEDGWFFEAHQKLRPVDFATDGVFLAGLAHYPKPMEESIAQAQAAAGRAVTLLTSPKLQVGGVVAEVYGSRCAGCGVCAEVCPYQAISLNQDGVAVVNEALCKGCGTCVASCRSGAIQLKGFTNAEVFAQIAACF
jgi:heterodisulfide reductase subunit A2